MARPLRIEYPGACYHVINRGNHRERVFHDDEDYLLFLFKLAEYSELFDVVIHSYCLMPNHYHLQLKTRQGNLGKFMQSFNTSFTLSMNRRHATNGHLFCGRYKAQLIQSKLYKNKLSRYIHLNPIKTESLAGCSIENLKTCLRNYRWSSFRIYIGLEKRPAWLDRTHVLSSWGTSASEKIRNYRRYVEQGLLSNNNQDLTQSEISNIIGTESFKDAIARKFLIRDMKDIDAKEQPELAKLNAPSPDEIIETIMKYFNLEKKEKITIRQGANLKCRRLAMYLSSTYCRKAMTLSEIAAWFGVTINGLSSAVDRFKTLLACRKRLVHELSEIEKRLSE